MKHNIALRGFFLTLTALSLCGCATYVTVSSEPPSHDVYMRGSGRSAYRWKSYGPSPVTFKAYYNAINTRVRWPDGSLSEPQRTSLLGQPNVTVHHVLASETEDNGAEP